MPEFRLDTSGHVAAQPAFDGRAGYGTSPGRAARVSGSVSWANLDAFTQGYIEALFFTSTGDDGEPLEQGFSDLAPETLSRIISDCERQLDKRRAINTPENGAAYWTMRQNLRREHADLLPPLTVQLGDDGRVYLA